MEVYLTNPLSVLAGPSLTTDPTDFFTRLHLEYVRMMPSFKKLP